METTKKNKSGLRSLLWILPLAGLLFLALAVWSVTERYSTQFLPGSTVMGIDCANMTIPQATAALTEAVDGTQVVLGDSSGIEIDRFPLDAFVEKDALAAAVKDAFVTQRSSARWYDWLMEGERSYSPAPLAGLTDQQVSEVIQTLHFAGEGRVEPKNAHVELTDSGYVVVDAEPGNLFNVNACARALGRTLRALTDLSEGVPPVIMDGAAIQPSVTSGSRAIRRQTDVLDAYFDQTVSLDFRNGNVYTLTPEDIRSVSDVSIFGYLVVCKPNMERLGEFTERIITDYGSDGVFAKFQHTAETRPYVYYRVGDTGWIMDRQDLTDRLAAALTACEDATLSPDYDYTWYWKAYYRGYRVGDTYIEISLDNQYMWCYLDGELLLETPIVTGDLANRNDTRRGCFKIAYKVADVVLKGPTWNDHVDYWMPFDGGIGLHDSSWRDEYGEDIYMTDGSHGCINTPLEAMKTIFETYDGGDFVIVY